MKILMVCLGNICRSPLAEGILQEKVREAGLSWTVDSAGTNGFHNGEEPHRLSQKVALEHGIDISRQISRQLKASDFENFDIIYALAIDVKYDMKRVVRNAFQEEKVILLMDEVYPGQNMDVPDPWSGPLSGYHEAYDLIDKACDAIIAKYQTKTRNSQPITRNS